jgi:hypothetical protein
MMVHATNSVHSTIVVQCFINTDDATHAITALRDAGFGADAIGVLARNVGAAETIAQATQTTAIEDVHRGTLTGRLIGGGGGALVGLATAALPGVGPLIGVTAMAVTGLIGASTLGVASGFLGALIATGVPEDEARQFREPFMRGEILVVVDAGDQGPEAERILGR